MTRRRVVTPEELLRRLGVQRADDEALRSSAGEVGVGRIGAHASRRSADPDDDHIEDEEEDQ